MGRTTCAVLRIVVYHDTRHKNLVTDGVVLCWLPTNEPMTCRMATGWVAELALPVPLAWRKVAFRVMTGMASCCYAFSR